MSPSWIWTEICWKIDPQNMSSVSWGGDWGTPEVWTPYAGDDSTELSYPGSAVSLRSGCKDSPVCCLYLCVEYWRQEGAWLAWMLSSPLVFSSLPQRKRGENYLPSPDRPHGITQTITGRWEMTPMLVICFRWNSNRAFYMTYTKFYVKICMIQQIIC